MTQPGWYPDPAGGNGQRYWDGHDWGPVAPATPPAPVVTVQNRSRHGCLISLLAVFLLFGGCATIAAIGGKSDHDSKTTSSSSSTRSYAATPTRTVTSTPKSGDGSDTVFIATLDMFDVPYRSKTGAIDKAKALCLWYSANNAFFEDGALQVLKENPGFTVADAGHFAGAATSAYCPRFGPEGN